MKEYRYAVQFKCGFTGKWVNYRKTETWSEAVHASDTFECLWGDETRIIGL